MVGSKGEQVSLVSPKRSLKAADDSSFNMTVPYEHKELYPGKWVLIVGGPSGIHETEVEISKIGRRQGDHGKPRLIFGHDR